MVKIPFLSKSQQRWCFAAEKRGELPKGTCQRWAKKTKNIAKLPEKVGAKSARGKKHSRGSRGN